MLNKLKIICALICITMIQTTSAVFFSGEVLKTDDVTVIILGDVHADTSLNFTMTEKQVSDLQNLAKNIIRFL